MKTWPFAVFGFIFLCLAGCRSDPGTALLERQNRLLEDEIYRLRGVIQDYEEGAISGCAGGEAVGSAPAGVEMQEIRESAGPPRESYAPRGRRSPSRQTVQPPQVELPSEAQPPGEIPDTFKHPVGTRPPGDGGNIPAELPKQWQESSGPNLPGPAEPQNGALNKSSRTTHAGTFEPMAKDDSTDVGQLVINQMLTGGYNVQGKSGDNGVLVVLETRDAKGRRLEAPGDVSVVLLDQSKSGAQARVARWDFAADDTAKLFRGTGVSRGMYVECPWPANPPQNNRLHLFVRYVTRDGRKLQADQSLEIAAPGEKTSGWTPSQSEIRPAVALEAESAPAQSDVQDLRAASRTNSAKLQRPAWSPDRF